MTRNIEEPVTTPGVGGGRGDSVTTHPAFGQISATRVSGDAFLYGSDFRHRAYMTVRISRSELHRNLSRDWPFEREHIVEIALSEAQWATFVSSPNMGQGVPCTIEHACTEGFQIMPSLPAPESRADQFGDELRRTMAKAVARLDTLIGQPNLTGKVKDEIRLVKQDLLSDLPFVSGQFGKHMEGEVERAKTEIHGYMTGALIRAGITALGEPPPLQIEHQEG